MADLSHLALHGTAHSTLDADLVADIQVEQVNPLVEILQIDFYINDELVMDAIQQQTSFNVFQLPTACKVDVFITKTRSFDRMQFQRRRLEVVANVPERKAYVATAEDIVLAKLEWFRMGGEVSDRQWRDILGVIKVQEDRLDLEYLKKWAIELGVTDLLQRALKESE